MSKWYIIEEMNYDFVPHSNLIILQERDGKIYERYVEDEDGNSWDVSNDHLFHAAHTVERLKRIMRKWPNLVREITEEEALLYFI